MRGRPLHRRAPRDRGRRRARPWRRGRPRGLGSLARPSALRWREGRQPPCRPGPTAARPRVVGADRLPERPWSSRLLFGRGPCVSRGGRADSKPWTSASRFLRRRRSSPRTWFWGETVTGLVPDAECPHGRTTQERTAPPVRPRNPRGEIGPTPTRTGSPSAVATSRRWRSRSEVRARKRMIPTLRAAPRMAPEAAIEHQLTPEPKGLDPRRVDDVGRRDRCLSPQVGLLSVALREGDLVRQGGASGNNVTSAHIVDVQLTRQPVVLPGEARRPGT